VVILLAYMLLISIFFVCLVGVGIFQVTLGLFWTLWAIAFYIYMRYCNYKNYNNTFSTGAVGASLMGIFAWAILVFYESTHGTVNELIQRGDVGLWDAKLLRMDDFFLGWIFPLGQLALWTDTNEYIGPESFVGSVVTEFLQLVYASFFGWCSLLIVYVGLWEYFIMGLSFQKSNVEFTGEDVGANNGDLEAGLVSAAKVKGNGGDVPEDKEPKKETNPEEVRTDEGKIYTYTFGRITFSFTHNREVWRNLLILICATLGAFLLNYSISFTFPALSPRVYLRNKYQHPLSGFWLGHQLRGAL